MDKLRRCEFGKNGVLSGKPILLVASPGGSGNGMLSCLPGVGPVAKRRLIAIGVHCAEDLLRCVGDDLYELDCELSGEKVNLRFL